MLRTYSTRPPSPRGQGWGRRQLPGGGRPYFDQDEDEEAEAEAEKAYINTRRSLLLAGAQPSPSLPLPRHGAVTSSPSSPSYSSLRSQARAARPVRVLPERAFAGGSRPPPGGQPTAPTSASTSAASCGAERGGGGLRFVPLSELLARWRYASSAGRGATINSSVRRRASSSSMGPPYLEPRPAAPGDSWC